MPGSFVVTDAMRNVAAELDARGVCSGCDYYVRGVPTEWTFSDGAVGLSYDGVTFTVEQRGRVTETLLETSDFEAARTAFVGAALAARQRPDRRLGARTPPPPARRAPRDRPVVNVVAAVLGGVLCGVVFPIAMAVAIVLDPNGNAGGTGSAPPDTPWRKRPFPPTRIAFWVGFPVGTAASLAAAGWWWLAR